MMKIISEELERVLKNFEKNTAVIIYNSNSDVQLITYEHVKEWATLLSANIQKYLGKKGLCVGLLMTHNLYIPSLVISLHNCGFSFIFLNPYAEKQDITAIVNKLGIRWIFSKNCGDIQNYVNNFKLISSVNDLSEYGSLKLWCLECIANIEKPVEFSNVCYVICTSGTTGNKKFVRVNDFCSWSNVRCFKKIFQITHEDTIYFGTSLSFDPSMIELFLAISTGAKLLIVPHTTHINPKKLMSALFPNPPCFYTGVTFLQMPPSVFLRYSAEDVDFIFNKSTLRILALGGEEFPNTLLNIRRSNLKIYNLYGITEVSCWATAMEIENGAFEIHLGNALDDTVIEVRDDSNSKIEEGEGELYIGSNSRICLIDDENNPAEDSFVFRATGDLVRILNGKFFYLGRKNDLIKRHGNRINLKCIEAKIAKETNLENKCVWYKDGLKLLLFFLLKTNDRVYKEKFLDKIRVKLLHILPNEHYPDFIDALQVYPLTSNGKIDKNALIQIYLLTTQTKKVLIDSFKPIDIFNNLLVKYFGLPRDNLSVYNNLTFFELGGNSILIMQFIEELRLMLSVENFPEKILTLLFEENIEKCRELLASCNLKRKLESSDNEHPPQKQFAMEKNLETLANLKIVWRHDFKACVDCTPAIAEINGEKVVAVGSFSHIFGVIDALNGNEIYKNVFNDTIESACCFHPKKPIVFVGCFDGNVYCINFKNFVIEWEYSTNDRIKSKPAVCLEGNAIVFGSYDKHIYCLLIESGKLLWKTHLEAGIASNPVCQSDRIYVASIVGSCFCVDANNGTIIWKYAMESPIFGSACTVGADLVCWACVSGKVCCLSQENGKLKWIYTTDGQIYATPTFHKNHITFGCHDHKLYCLQISDTTCQLKYKTPLNSQISSSTSVMHFNACDLSITATTSGLIYVVNFDSGEVVNCCQLPGQVFSSVCVWNDCFYVGCRDNNLYCITLEKIDDNE